MPAAGLDDLLVLGHRQDPIRESNRLLGQSAQENSLTATIIRDPSDHEPTMYLLQLVNKTCRSNRNTYRGHSGARVRKSEGG